MNGFLNDLATKVLLFDGAMGTEIQKYEPKENDFLNNKEGFNDSLNFTHPDWIKTIHKTTSKQAVIASKPILLVAINLN